MRKKWIYLLMAVISTMLVTLMVIQVAWLRNAAEAEQREKQVSIDRALERVSDQLRSGSFCFESFGKTYIDSGERFFMMHGNKNGVADTMEIFYDEAFTRDNKVGKMNVMDLSLPFSLDIQLRATVIINDTAGYLAERKAFYDGLSGSKLNDIIRNKRPIDSVYNMAHVDSIIKANLARENVDTVFGFGIINAENNQVAYRARITDTAKLAQSPYSVSLFTDNRFMAPYRLAVVLPRATAYRVSYLLLISIAVVLLLTFSFYAFVRLYLKQTHLSQMKSDFIHNLTHEFNTPMANISLALETLEGGSNTMDPKTNRVINIIAAESARLRENIERSLQVAVMEDGALLLHKEEVDMVQLITTVISSYTLQCEALGGKITFAPAADPLLRIDEAHVLNAVVNLLDNAIKYRSGAPEITIGLDEKHNEVILTVADNGIGMSSETQKHIFDKFYRAHEGDTHNTKGFGLGLSYVKGIVDAHGGAIEVWSRKGAGSRFTIRLPKTTRNGTK